MNLQKPVWKVFLRTGEEQPAEKYFKVFNSWIPESPEVFIDVADYRHVHGGPLIALIGHYEDYYLDSTWNRIGLLYNRRQPLGGSNLEKLTQSLLSVLDAAWRLECDGEFERNLEFDPGDLVFSINDRAIAPNTTATLESIEDDFRSALQSVLGTDSLQWEHKHDPTERFTLMVRADHALPLRDIASAPHTA